jgi:hypothetical protein
MTERDLFGRIVLVRNWGRNSCELVEEFAGDSERECQREPPNWL